MPKPTIAMVNGWCFGGAFTPLVACDLAIAADEATFGLSEINWGIPPGSVVSKALNETVGARTGLLYVMTGRTFDGKQAAAMGLVNASVPRERLRDEVAALARELLEKNPVVLRAAARLQAVRRDELTRRGLPPPARAVRSTSGARAGLEQSSTKRIADRRRERLVIRHDERLASACGRPPRRVLRRALRRRLPPRPHHPPTRRLVIAPGQRPSNAQLARRRRSRRSR
jgi:enoyl-CoA hydratase/carnithine racemase